MRLQIFLLYLATWSLIAVTPGPAVMCAMAQASRYGFRSSFAGITGIQCGNLLFFIWIALLQHWELSQLFPFEGFAPALLVIAARIFLKEKLPLIAWIGIALITGGTVLVSGS